jgi:hypothetical protein
MTSPIRWYLNTTGTRAPGIDNPAHFADKQDDTLLSGAIGTTTRRRPPKSGTRRARSSSTGRVPGCTSAAYVDACALSVGGLNATVGGRANGHLFRYGWVSLTRLAMRDRQRSRI